jgi:hypothetical protein
LVALRSFNGGCLADRHTVTKKICPVSCVFVRRFNGIDDGFHQTLTDDVVPTSTVGSV